MYSGVSGRRHRGATRAMHTVMSDLCTGCNLLLTRARRTASRCNRLQKHLTLEMGSEHHSRAYHSRGTPCLVILCIQKK